MLVVLYTPESNKEVWWSSHTCTKDCRIKLRRLKRQQQTAKSVEPAVETAPTFAKSAFADFIFIGLDGIPEEKST
jgi:hypothetical protein